ncbi:hypothetical protein AVO45_16290 [Ruegeria marisrubri]|uniref:Response regulatory domain-containing protein n=1 Tax=Ruegeria marisrubri TaxID=1685379 RepID=A0A0X3UB62_9RHOB|nr:response regulator [Ruegeria marisrubri]KUJ85313.1 hypothetical protein AVO45_16290 [Ruegeria marisrubri]
MKHSNPGREKFQRKLEHRAQKQKMLKVLAVDDEQSILELLQTALAAFGNCDVSVADSASSALEIVKASDTPFDCLLLDIQMPGTSGIELLKKIRSLPDYSETPAIMLTAMSDRKYVEEAFLEGASDYITKPFDFLDLRNRMSAAHLLKQERIEARRNLNSAKCLREELDHNQKFSFEDPLSIHGPNRILQYVEFDNYIDQLSRGRLFDSSVTAVKLLDAENYYHLSSFGDFRRAVSDLGRAIEIATKDAAPVFSYRGSGAFLIVTHGRSRTGALPSKERLNQVFKAILGRRGASGQLHALMGKRVSMRSISRAGAFAAMAKALENVNRQELELIDGVNSLSVLNEELEPVQQETVRKRVYERVMLELVGEESCLTRK